MSRLQPFAVLVWMSGLVAVSVCAWGCDAEIQHGLAERDANRIVAVLRQAGIRAEKVREKGRNPRFTVTVDSKQAARAFRILQAQELPPRPKKGVPELFGKSGLVPTSTEEHVKMVYALGSEVARTLEQMDGVLSARVHLVIPRERGLADLSAAKPEPRASVFLKIRPGSAPATVAEIKNLVAGAVSGLSAGSVSVILRPGPKIDLAGARVPAGTPLWIKAVALGGCAAALVLGILVVLLSLRLKRAREQAAPVEDQGEWTGTERQSLRSTSSVSGLGP